MSLLVRRIAGAASTASPRRRADEWRIAGEALAKRLVARAWRETWPKAHGRHVRPLAEIVSESLVEPGEPGKCRLRRLQVWRLEAFGKPGVHGAQQAIGVFG